MSRFPLDLQTLVRQVQKKEEDALKPVYIGKEERERIARERREKEEEERRRLHLEEQRLREQYIRGRSDDFMIISEESPLSKDELTAIKERYIGASKKRTKTLKRHGDKKTLFEWDEQDDTGALPSQIIPSKNHSRLFQDSEVEITHWSSKKLENMTDRDWRILKEDFGISTQGGLVPHPIRKWEEHDGIDEEVKYLVRKLGYENPTPIQRQAIPIALQKRDLIGIAETGSGKTLAFLIPILCFIQKLPRMNEEHAAFGPYALILAPTRELALQIEQVAKRFCSDLGFRAMSIVGGHSISEQSMHFRRGAEIIIATPGRLRDCLEQHVLALGQCYSVVLDEADRMIDLNFEEDLNFILSCLPLVTESNNSRFYRQMTMFSATMPASVGKLAKLYLKRPTVVTVGEAGAVVDRIHQKVQLISEQEKPHLLAKILEEFEFPIIIFVNQKTTVDFLYSRLTALGYRALPLHGGKGQEQREHAISQLKSGSKDILIATDVASRGIDISDVKLVLNYDMAKTIEDYVHRIGRTGRAGKEGHAVTFLTDKDTDVYYDLRMLLQKSPNSSYPSEFSNHESARNKPGSIQQKKRHEEKIFAFGV